MLYTDKREIITFKQIKSIASICCVLVLLVACQSTTPMMPNSVQFVDHTLEKHLLVSNLRLSSTAAGNLQLNAQIQNTSSSDMVLEINTDWYDDNFSPSEVSSGWNRVFLARNQSIVYQSLAVNETSKDFVINIRNGGS